MAFQLAFSLDILQFLHELEKDNPRIEESVVFSINEVEKEKFSLPSRFKTLIRGRSSWRVPRHLRRLLCLMLLNHTQITLILKTFVLNPNCLSEKDDYSQGMTNSQTEYEVKWGSHANTNTEWIVKWSSWRHKVILTGTPRTVSQGMFVWEDFAAYCHLNC